MENILLSNDKKSKDEYKKIMTQTIDAIADSFDSEKAYSGPKPEELKKLVHQNTILPEHGLGWDETFRLTKEKILPNLLRPSSVNYMPHLHSPCVLESLSSETIISAFNQSMDSWDQSPVATEIECEVINHLCRLYGYDENASGVFTSGGSQSNETAIILARDWFVSKILKHDIKKSGLPENFRKLRMYTSEISHFSMEKSAAILGLGYDSVVKVPVDSKMRLDFKELSRLVENDIQKGNIPFLIVATIGTTDFGSIDPLEKIAELCKKHNIWLHSDAAYGSGIVLSEKYKNRVSALNLSDSITIDFHKMFLLPISCSCVLAKDKHDFESLTIHADYLNRKEDEEDGYTNLVDKSIQTTRRFDALKVWMSFQERGKDGWSKIITKSMENASYLYKLVEENPNFETITEPEISSVVFRFIKNETDSASKVLGNAEPPEHNEKENDEINKRIRRELLHEHGIVIGQTLVNNKVFLKFTLLNPLMTTEKLDELVKLIEMLCKNY